MRTRWVRVCLLVISAVGSGVPAYAADPSPDVLLSIENHRFSPEELRVKAGAPFMLVITNKDRVPQEFEMPDFRIEKEIPAGRTRRLKMPALKPGTYGFLGEYQETTVKGRIVAE